MTKNHARLMQCTDSVMANVIGGTESHEPTAMVFQLTEREKKKPQSLL